MKKLAMIATGVLSLGYLGAFEMQTLGLDTSVKYSNENEVRGRKQGSHVFVPKAEVNMPVFEKGKIYAGTWAILGTDAKKDMAGLSETRNEVNPYIGVSYDITDVFTLDLGYIHHFYTNTPKYLLDESSFYVPSALKRDTNEIYFGVMADVLLSPSLYFFYDFDAEEIAIEGRVAYTFDLAQFGVNGVVLDLGAKLGYDKADKPFACKKYYKELSGDKDYVYYGVNADLVYTFNEHAKARAGVEFAGNNAKKNSWVNSGSKLTQEGAHKNLVWFNASVDCSF